MTKPDDPAVVALQRWCSRWGIADFANALMAQRAVDIVRAPLITRLAIDAHNETGSVREYARSLLADLGQPLPPDPEKPAPPTGPAPWPFTDDAEPFNLAPSASADPFDATPGHTGGMTGKPGPVFTAQYDSPCPYGDKIYEGDFVRATGGGEFAHEDCMREAGDIDD